MPVAALNPVHAGRLPAADDPPRFDCDGCGRRFEAAADLALVDKGGPVWTCPHCGTPTPSRHG